MFKKIFSLIMCVLMLSVISACKKEGEISGNNENIETEQIDIPKTDTKNEDIENQKVYEDAVKFTIELENGGVMKGEIYPNLAPETTDNFIELCKDNFYDGLIFHRVIKNFMIQGGGYDKDMVPKETQSIKGEFTNNGFENNLKHTRGVLSMARTPDPDSASSQFFIMHKDAPHLDGDYAAFGRIIEGLDIVDEIATSDTGINSYGMPDSPIEPIIIKTITIDK